MKNVMTMLLSFLLVLCMVFVSVASADKVNMMVWDAPTTNEDGTPLTDLDGYNAKCGIVSGDYTINYNVGLIETVSLVMLLVGQPDNWYFCAVTAYDTSKPFNESIPSEEILVRKRGTDFFGTDGVSPSSPKNNRLQ
jgi:hypothetical protein